MLWIIPLDEIPAAEAQQQAVDEALCFATADTSAPHRALDGDFALAGDRGAHGGVGQVIAFRRGDPAWQHAQDISGRIVFASLTAGRRADQAEHRQKQCVFFQ